MSADLAALIATCISLTSSIPQVRRTWRTTQIAGVSLAACALGAVTEAYWAIYSVDRRLWGAVPVAVMMMIANATLAFMLIRRGARGVGAALLAALVWTCTMLSIALWAGIDALGPLIGLAYVVQAGPTIWTVTRTAVPSGVSRARWWLIAVEAVLWGFYGVTRHDPATIVFGVVGLTTAVLMLAHTAPHGTLHFNLATTTKDALPRAATGCSQHPLEVGESIPNLARPKCEPRVARRYPAVEPRYPADGLATSAVSTRSMTPNDS